MIDGAREVLLRLRGRLGLIGFVSGRGIDDLRGRIGIPGCAYAGNHGFELQAPGGPTVTAAAARPWLQAIAALAADWAEGAPAQRGLHVEPKGATFSVHWRNAPDRAAAQALLQDVLAPQARDAGLAVTWGRMVMEVRPPAAIDKGTAVAELLGSGTWRHAAYVGDDRTDADAWQALHRMRAAGALRTAVAVLVAGSETAGDLYDEADADVNGPDEVLELLRALDTGLRGSR